MRVRDAVLSAASDLETALRRHEATYNDDPAPYGDATYGYTDLTDAFGWTLSAFDALIQTMPPSPVKARMLTNAARYRAVHDEILRTEVTG